MSPASARPQPLRGLSPEQVEADQRARIYTALGPAMARHSYEQMTVEHLVKGAGISRRTFYELFEGKSDAFCEAHAEALKRLAECVRAAAQPEPEWTAAVAAGIAAALGHFASDPAAAHLVVAEPLAAGPRPAYCHRLLVERFSPCLRQGREHASLEPGPHLEELLLASLAAMVATRLREGRAESLPELAPALTRLVLAPYLGGKEARRVASERAAG
jgi:AcrR family transcriptional regulator